MNNSDISTGIETIIEKYCDGTFLNGLKSAHFMEMLSPQSCADEIKAYVFGVLEDEVKPLRAALESLRVSEHDECDDNFYSCPKHPEYIGLAERDNCSYRE